MVSIYLRNIKNTSKDAVTTFVLPSILRPNDVIQVPIIDITNQKIMAMYIDQNGDVKISNPGFTSWYELNVVYIGYITYII